MPKGRKQVVMTTDFNLRVYHPNKGNNPMILTNEKESSDLLYNGRKQTFQTLELRPYSLYLREDREQPFGKAERLKQIMTPGYNSDSVECRIGQEKGTARKVIYRTQPKTNNTTTIAIDYVSDKAVAEGYRPKNYVCGQKVVELTRDLKDGDVFELIARQDKKGRVVADKLALKSGKIIENIPEFFQRLSKELDPLAKNWIKKVFMHLI